MINRRQLITGTAALLAYSALPKEVEASSAIIVRRANGLDWSNITLFSRMESDTLDSPANDYSAGDTTWIQNSNAVFNASAVKYGTNGLDCPSASDYLTLDTASIMTSAEGRIGFWLDVITQQDNQVLFQYYKDANNSIQVRLRSTDELYYRWEDNSTLYTFTTTDSAFGDASGYLFVEFAYKTSTNFRGFWVNGVEKLNTTADAMSTFAVESTDMQIGAHESLASDIHIDNLIIATDSTKVLYPDFAQATAYGQ